MQTIRSRACRSLSLCLRPVPRVNPPPRRLISIAVAERPKCRRATASAASWNAAALTSLRECAAFSGVRPCRRRSEAAGAPESQCARAAGRRARV
jgi:hypothetical protein